MADEFRQLTDPVERNAYALSHFGRSGLEVEKVLDAGGKKIRDYSAAVEDNMVLTEEQVRQARELEIAEDNLGDAWTGVTYTVGNAFIPVIADGMEILSAWHKEVMTGTNNWLRYIPIVGTVYTAITGVNAAIANSEKVSEEAGIGMGDLRLAEYQASVVTANYTAATIAQSYATMALTQRTQEQIAAEEEKKVALDAMPVAIGAVAAAEQAWSEGAGG